MKIQELIYQLPFNDFMDIRDFLHIDNYLKNNERLTNNKIVVIIKSNNNELEIDPNKEFLEIISKKEALGCLDNLVLFFRYLSDISIDLNKLNIL